MLTPMVLVGLSIVALFAGVALVGAPYVPSHRRQAHRALTELYRLGPDDVLVDLGSGDGVVVRLATQLGAARALGIEINPVLVGLSKLLSLRQRRAHYRLGDMWRVRLPGDTTVVYVFTVSRDSRRLVHRLATEAARLGRPLWVISYGIDLAGQTPVRAVGAHTLYQIAPVPPRVV